MRRVRQNYVMAAAIALALGLAVLPGCGESAKPSGAAVDESQIEAPEDPAPDEPDEPASNEPDDSDLILDDGDDNMTYLTIEQASGEIEVGSFTFSIPDYWAGKVTCDVEVHPSGTCRAVVHLPEDADALLARLELEEGDDPRAMGDLGSHMVGSVADGNGSHVEVWTNNWPWLAANGSAGEMSDDQLARLVDLSSGGALTLDDAQTLQEGDISMAEVTFTSSAIVPTIAFG